MVQNRQSLSAFLVLQSVRKLYRALAQVRATLPYGKSHSAQRARRSIVPFPAPVFAWFKIGKAYLLFWCCNRFVSCTAPWRRYGRPCRMASRIARNARDVQLSRFPHQTVEIRTQSRSAKGSDFFMFSKKTCVLVICDAGLLLLASRPSTA